MIRQCLFVKSLEFMIYLDQFYNIVEKKDSLQRSFMRNVSDCHLMRKMFWLNELILWWSENDLHE